MPGLLPNWHDSCHLMPAESLYVQIRGPADLQEVPDLLQADEQPAGHVGAQAEGRRDRRDRRRLAYGIKVPTHAVKLPQQQRVHVARVACNALLGNRRHHHAVEHLQAAACRH